MTTRFVSCISACALILALGCGGPTKGPDSAALENVSQATGGGENLDLDSGWAKVGKTALAKRAFSLFASNTNFVFGFDMAALTSSELYGQYRGAIENALRENNDMEAMLELREMCGLDPLVELKQVIVGSFMDPFGEVQQGATVMVIHGITRARFVQCSQAVAARDGGQVVEDGEFTLTTDESGKDKWVMWLDNDTMVVGDKLTREEISARRAQRGVSGNEEMHAMLEQVAQDRTAWLVMRPDSGLQVPESGMMFSRPFTVAGIFGSVQVSAGLDLKVAARMIDSEQAVLFYEELSAKLREARPMLDAFGMGAPMDKLELGTIKADVSLSLPLSAQDMKQLIDSLGAM